MKSKLISTSNRAMQSSRTLRDQVHHARIKAAYGLPSFFKFSRYCFLSCVWWAITDWIFWLTDWVAEQIFRPIQDSFDYAISILKEATKPFQRHLPTFTIPAKHPHSTHFRWDLLAVRWQSRKLSFSYFGGNKWCKEIIRTKDKWITKCTS